MTRHFGGFFIARRSVMKRTIVAFGLLTAALVGIASAAPSVSDHDIVPIAQYVQPVAAAHDLAVDVVATDWKVRAEHAAMAADATCVSLISITAAGQHQERCTQHRLRHALVLDRAMAQRFRPPDTA